MDMGANFDTLKDIDEVRANVNSLRSYIDELKGYTSEITSIRNMIDGAWKSNNATAYIETMDNMIKAINGDATGSIGALQSLENYFKKIEGVVQQLEKFDQAGVVTSSSSESTEQNN